jgi:hypothetical protein
LLRSPVNWDGDQTSVLLILAWRVAERRKTIAGEGGRGVYVIRKNLEILNPGNCYEEEIHAHEEKSAPPGENKTKS